MNKDSEDPAPLLRDEFWQELEEVNDDLDSLTTEFRLEPAVIFMLTALISLYGMQKYYFHYSKLYDSYESLLDAFKKLSRLRDRLVEVRIQCLEEHYPTENAPEMFAKDFASENYRLVLHKILEGHVVRYEGKGAAKMQILLMSTETFDKAVKRGARLNESKFCRVGACKPCEQPK